MKEMEIETAGTSGSWREMETEMESGSWMEMEMEMEMESGSWMEMEMETVMEASEALATSTTNRNVCNPKRPPHRTGLCSLRTRRPCLSRRMFPSPHAPFPVAWTSRCA